MKSRVNDFKFDFTTCKSVLDEVCQIFYGSLCNWKIGEVSKTFVSFSSQFCLFLLFYGSF